MALKIKKFIDENDDINDHDKHHLFEKTVSSIDKVIASVLFSDKSNFSSEKRYSITKKAVYKIFIELLRTSDPGWEEKRSKSVIENSVRMVMN